MAAFSSAPRPARAALHRVLGLGFGLAVAVGGTAGTGVLTGPGELARALGGPGYLLGFWLLGGLYTLLAANAVAELAGRLPQAGGWYGYTQAAFGEFPAVVVAWADWTSSCVTGALVALLLGDYATQLLPAALGLPPTLLAAASVLACVAVQWRSLQAGGRLQELTAAVLVLVVLGVVVAAAVWLPAPPAHSHPAALPAPTPLQVVAALQVVIFAYDGWYAPIYFAEETPQPAPTLPRALLGGVGLVLALYFCLNASLLYHLPFAQLPGRPLPLAELAGALAGRLGRGLLLGLALLALAGVLNSVLLMATRVLFALGRAGQLPRGLARVAPGGTPRRALLVAGALTLALALSGTVEAFEAVTSILFVGYYVVGFLALFYLRRRAAAPAAGVYLAKGHPWTTGVLVLASASFLVLNAVLDIGHAAVALGLVAGAWPLWAWARRRPAR